MSENSQIIAERIYTIEGQSEPAVIVRLWRPYKPEPGYPRCRLQLISSTETSDREVTASDAFDCIITALAVAGSTIAGWNESIFGGRLRWEGWPEGGRGLGLPTIEDHWPLRDKYQDALRWAQERKGRQDQE